MKHNWNHFFFEGRIVFLEGGAEGTSEMTINMDKGNVDTISHEAEDFLWSVGMTLENRVLISPSDIPNIDFGQGGDLPTGTKKMDVYVRGGQLYIDAHNNNGTTDTVRVDAGGAVHMNNEEKPYIVEEDPEVKDGDEKVNTSGSHADAPHTIAGVMEAMETLFTKAKNKEWEFGPKGKTLAQNLPRLYRDLSELRDIMDSKAQKGGVDEINKFLRERGFSIQLEDSKSPFDLYAASVLDMNVRWQDPGKPTTLSLEDDGKSVDAVSMKNVRSFYEVPGHDHPIVEIETETGEKVFMTKYEKTIPEDPTALMKIAEGFSQSKTQTSGLKGVIFPMVDFQDSGNIDAILGAQIEDKNGDPVVIGQAKYQYRFRMNEVGARAQAAAAAAVAKTRGISFDRPIFIDGDFLVWFEKNGIIAFSAKIGEEHMKKPENLE